MISVGLGVVILIPRALIRVKKVGQFLFTFIYFSKLKLKEDQNVLFIMPYDTLTLELVSREGKETHSSITSIAMSYSLFVQKI